MFNKDPILLDVKSLIDYACRQQFAEGKNSSE